MYYFCRNRFAVEVLSMKSVLINIIAAIFLLLSAPFAHGQDAGKQTEAFLKAVAAYSSGDIDAAERQFAALIAKDAKNDAAYYYKALCRLAKHDSNGARELINTAVALDSTNYWYREIQLSTYDSSEELDLIIARYERLLKDFPKNTNRQYVLMNLYMAAGSPEKALSVLDDIEGRDGKSDASVMTRSSILRKQDKIEEAYKVLKDYVAEYSSPYVLTVLGEYEMGMYNDANALAYFDEALSLEDGYFPARLGRAETFRLTRKYPQYFQELKDIIGDREAPAGAKSDYLVQVLRGTDQRFLSSFKPQLDSIITEAVEIHPSDSVMLQTASAYSLYAGDTDAAADYAKRCWDIYPDSRGAAYAYLSVIYRGEDWPLLSEGSSKAMEAFPEEEVFLEMNNLAKYNLKDYKGVLQNSIRQLEMAAGDSAKTLSALSGMGYMYHLLGDNKNAYKCYDQALKVNPEYAPVLNNYAWYLCLEGKQLKKALKMSRKTIELEPKNATYLDTYGWILHLTGKSLEAKMFFKQAMLYGGKESATIMAHYVVVLEALGEKELADVYRTQMKALPKEDE